MRKHDKREKPGRLLLNQEKLRDLQPEQLEAVVGGGSKGKPCTNSYGTTH
jgi:hypothetical protein